jgi:hypothetical protein
VLTVLYLLPGELFLTTIVELAVEVVVAVVLLWAGGG